jgi:molybdenum cofactor guanylyltransferase
MPQTPDAPLYGLVLIGGKSSRMGREKAMLEYHDEPEWKRVLALLQTQTTKAFISVNPDQAKSYDGVPQVLDSWDSIGPMNGVASAFGEFPAVAWIVVACDMPNLNGELIQQLVKARNPNCDATVFMDADERLEPLCAIYEPTVVEGVLDSILREDYSLFRCLEQQHIERVPLENTQALKNINTNEESEMYRQHSVD